MSTAIKFKQQAGVSLIETLAVVFILSILLAFAVPMGRSISQVYAIAGDVRSISADLNLARMRAAADFTHARLYADLAGNTYHVDFWNKTKSCWQTFNDLAANTCTAANSPVIKLAPGDSFGFGSLTQGPTTATSTIAQAAACNSGVAGTSPGTATANTACIEFNSRGFPVDSTGKVVASDALYVQNNLKNLFSAVTVPVAGQPTMYNYSGASTWSPY
jgi:prepilin-type N-terminal cleavage/methylation domain-containing protein